MFTSGTLKKSLVEALCLWKNLCSRKNQERKKVLSKKKKKKKARRRKKEYHSVKKRKIFLCKRDMLCRSSTMASIFRTKQSPSNQTLPYTMLKTRFPFLYWSLDTKTSTIASNRNFKSCLSICCLAPQQGLTRWRFSMFAVGFSLLWQLCSLLCRPPQRSTERSRILIHRHWRQEVQLSHCLRFQKARWSPGVGRYCLRTSMS